VSKVKITWKAFGDKPEAGKFVSSVEFETEFKLEDWYIDQFLNIAYRQTNTYSGNLWEIIEPQLSPIRTHTALSVGDEIEIDGQVYIVADFGFEKIEDVEIEYLPEAYGIKSVFRVTVKDKAVAK
jgi:hypothetical protein